MPLVGSRGLCAARDHLFRRIDWQGTITILCGACSFFAAIGIVKYMKYCLCWFYPAQHPFKTLKIRKSLFHKYICTAALGDDAYVVLHCDCDPAGRGK